MQEKLNWDYYKFFLFKDLQCQTDHCAERFTAQLAIFFYLGVKKGPLLSQPFQGRKKLTWPLRQFYKISFLQRAQRRNDLLTHVPWLHLVQINGVLCWDGQSLQRTRSIFVNRQHLLFSLLISHWDFLNSR